MARTTDKGVHDVSVISKISVACTMLLAVADVMDRAMDNPILGTYEVVIFIGSFHLSSASKPSRTSRMWSM
ncbi:MAG: hypothetical protein A4E62_02640 [Syntrophorhabdus sp. PtaU1.Bin002]|nr:MAG: hypothetical protein A4E62_02640 [Syntrophorhabdus sp. PtaU1.Bin002]